MTTEIRTTELTDPRHNMCGLHIRIIALIVALISLILCGISFGGFRNTGGFRVGLLSGVVSILWFLCVVGAIMAFLFPLCALYLAYIIGAYIKIGICFVVLIWAFAYLGMWGCYDFCGFLWYLVIATIIDIVWLGFASHVMWRAYKWSREFQYVCGSPVFFLAPTPLVVVASPVVYEV